MTKKCLFVAVNLPQEIKENLSCFKNNFPFRWVKKENLHMTLAFYGYTNQEDQIKEKLRGVFKDLKPFKVEIKRISFVSNRMIWALVETPKDFLSVVKKINPEFIAHITLARINKWQLNLEEMPLIDQDISLKFKVDSIELMQSRINSNYSIIEKFVLKND